MKIGLLITSIVLAGVFFYASLYFVGILRIICLSLSFLCLIWMIIMIVLVVKAAKEKKAHQGQSGERK
jgi:NADH:ubiquinone oxidoreductase subunit 6 (subunit J)